MGPNEKQKNKVSYYLDNLSNSAWMRILLILFACMLFPRFFLLSQDLSDLYIDRISIEPNKLQKPKNHSYVKIQFHYKKKVI